MYTEDKRPFTDQMCDFWSLIWVYKVKIPGEILVGVRRGPWQADLENVGPLLSCRAGVEPQEHPQGSVAGSDYQLDRFGT